MNPADQKRIRHLVDALNSAIRFAQGRRRDDLDQDEMLLFALIHAIQIAGEAASKISDRTRGVHPEIPWAKLIGIRHRLVHAYFDINRDILWTTVSQSVPELLGKLSLLVD